VAPTTTLTYTYTYTASVRGLCTLHYTRSSHRRNEGNETSDEYNPPPNQKCPTTKKTSEMTKPVAVSRLRELLASLQTSATRVVQLYGANTDVGKTLVSVGLVREALRRGGGTAYLKPMQTVRTYGRSLEVRWKFVDDVPMSVAAWVWVWAWAWVVGSGWLWDTRARPRSSPPRPFAPSPPPRSDPPLFDGWSQQRVSASLPRGIRAWWTGSAATRPPHPLVTPPGQPSLFVTPPHPVAAQLTSPLLPPPHTHNQPINQ